MKPVLLFVLLFISGMSLFSQNDSVLKVIFIPHLRSEDKVVQSVAAGIAKIDFSKFDVKMLGGDLTYYTSDERSTLEYCDSLFDLGNPNTLWTFGNHDVQSGNRALIKEFTGRDGFYSYYRDGVTFIVLDTEKDANGFNNTFIYDDQLQMVKNVCDSIKQSQHLIVLHHRLIWMINSEYFKSRLNDSIAASSRTMDTTNFYSEIYPLLQKVKNKGIPVHLFGGDKSKINIQYSPEDSITFYAARLASDFPDSINNVVVFNYDLKNKSYSSEFVPLDEISKDIQDTLTSAYYFEKEKILKVWQQKGSIDVSIQLNTDDSEDFVLQVYSIKGTLYKSYKFQTNIKETITVPDAGIYIAKAVVGRSTYVNRFSVY